MASSSLAAVPALAPPAPARTPPRTISRPRRSASEASRTIDGLHARHGAELLRFCRWMLKDPEEAQDALQDTWMRALSALGEDRVAVTALRPWLYAVARNACLDRLRARNRASIDELDEDAAGSAPGADEVVALRQEAGAALALVGSLSERQRSALLMREIAGMTIPDIAVALGVTPDRAAWAVADARRALDETRAGTTLACEDAQSRLAAGHRGRTLRAHLGHCGPCSAHDRRLRARRVLAPALLPLLWLRRIAALLFANPGAVAATVAVTVATGGVPRAPGPAHVVRPADRAAGTPAPPSVAGTQGATPLPSRATAQRRPSLAENREPRVRVAPRAATSTAPPTAPVIDARPASPPPAPTPPAGQAAVPEAASPVTGASVAVSRVVVAPVRRVVAAATTVAQDVPVAGPVVGDVATAANRVLDDLG